MEEFLGASANREHGGGRRGKHPQPQQLTVLLPARLVGMQQVAGADLGEQLLLDDRLEGTPGLMQALVDGRYAELQAEPVGEELLDAAAREAHAQGQGTNQRHQHRSGQMALTQGHRPGGIIAAVARLGATAVPTATDVLVVEVLALKDFQTGALGGRRLQVDHQIAGMGASGVLKRQRAAAAGADPWVVVMGLFDGQLLHTPVSRGAGALSGTAFLRRLIRRTLLALAPLLWPLRLFVLGTRWVIRTFALLGPLRRITTILTLPRRATARGAGTVGRILIEPLVCGLQVRQQLHGQGTQLRLWELCQITFVELGEIETRQLHVVAHVAPASALAPAPVAARSCHTYLALSHNLLLFQGRV